VVIASVNRGRMPVQSYGHGTRIRNRSPWLGDWLPLRRGGRWDSKLHVITVNYFYDRWLTSIDDLLDRYATLTGWADGLKQAGADVTVVQRFGRDAEVQRDGVQYLFVRCPTRRIGSIVDVAWSVDRAVATLRPDVVHVNGIGFARQAWWLKQRLPSTPFLLQDHANHPPGGRIGRATFKRALRQFEAISFAARGLADPWIDAGMIAPDAPIVELMEGSSDFRLLDRESCRQSTGQSGDPLCIWVGRLDENKDPLTVLRGFAAVVDKLPSARLVMAYAEAPLLDAVQEWLKDNPVTASHVEMLGTVPHAELEALYNSADLLLLGSHHEGSGYAVLEAMACGVIPIVTDIPSFRVLTADGSVGGLWPVGDSTALARTVLERWDSLPFREGLGVGFSEPMSSRAQTRVFFDAHWSFGAIGRSAMTAYQSLQDGDALRVPVGLEQLP
jgi:glycosyltransferase involved in cell wall biosynthesis